MIKLIDLIILFIIYKLFNLNIIGKIVDSILPFLLSFVLAYALYPLLKRLNKLLPKFLSILIIIIILISTIIFSYYTVVPVLIKETSQLVKTITYILKILSLKYQLNIDIVLSKLSNIDYKYIISSINYSIGYIAKIILFVVSFIYFLIDMERIENSIKKINNKKIYNYLYILSKNMKEYISAIMKICIISFFEYELSFLIIGHKDYILMGFVACLSNLIPGIGCIFILIIGIITSPNLIIKISILYLILSNVDGYIINPYIFKKTNNIHPIINLIVLSIGSTIFGFKGIILSLPITIFLITTYNYFKNDNYNLKIVNCKQTDVNKTL